VALVLAKLREKERKRKRDFGRRIREMGGIFHYRGLINR
jgi:hypothetical protein